MVVGMYDVDAFRQVDVDVAMSCRAENAISRDGVNGYILPVSAAQGDAFGVC